MNREPFIRLARSGDTGGMLEITRDVWDGTDYVPLVWNGWLHDSSGALFVAYLGRRLVALQHIEIQPDNTAWLEGIRVAADVQGQGVGMALLQHGIQWARDAGCSTVRLATTSANPASNRIAEKAGLVCIASFIPLSAPAERGSPTSARVALPSDLGRIWSFLDGRGDADFYTEGWTAYRLTRERLRVLLAGHTVSVVDREDVQAVGIVTASARRPVARVGLTVGEPAEVKEVVRAMRTAAGAMGMVGVRATLNADATTVRALEQAGLARSGQAWEHSMLLHELSLA